MADGLGDIASLLGHSMSQAAQRGEEQDRKSRKKAMKDQLLMSLAAPIVTGLGKGVVDFAGDVVLGSDSKDFFSTREGRTMTKRLNDTGKASKSIADQITQLRKVGVASGGTGDLHEGVYQSNRNAIIDKKKREFGTIAGADTQIESAMVSIDAELREQSNKEADELLDFQRQLSFGSDLSNQELLARYKASPIGKGKARKFAGKVASFFTGKDYQKDVVEVAADGLITGGDLEIQNSEWFKMFKSEGFQKELADKLRAAQDIRGNLFDEQDQQNVLAQLNAENQGVFARLEEQKQADTDDLQARALIRAASRTNPMASEVEAEVIKNYGKQYSAQNYMSVLTSQYKTIAPDELDGFVQRYSSTETDSFETVKTAMIAKLTGSSEPFTSASTTDQEAALEATDAFFKQSAGAFNFAVINKIEELKNSANADDMQKYLQFTELHTSGGMQRLGNQYLTTLVNGLPIVPVGEGAMKGGSINKFIETTLNGAPDTLQNRISPELQKELDAIIDRGFGDTASIVQREEEATTSGLNLSRARSETSSGGVYVVSPQFLNQVESSIASIMNDSTLSKEERKEKALTRLALVDNSVEAKSNSLGFSKIDPNYEADRNKLLKLINGSSTVVPSSQVSRTNFNRTSAF